jgi:Tannase and feruloyl esterase
VLGAPAGYAAAASSDPAAACTGLANLTNFPVAPTQITSAQFNPAGAVSANGVPLPAHCQIDGIINKRVGSDGYPYGDRFEVRLPTPTDWNGRFMFQGGGGTEGSVPPATGTAGTLSPALAHGWAVASQDGGHENSQLPFPNQFFLEPQAVIDYAYRSIEVTNQTAKYLIKVYYGDEPRHSYWVGCSTGGRQGMVMSQNFPDYFDGIVAGDPVYDLEAISLSEDWGVQQIYDITPQPIQTLSDGSPILYPAFPLSDQQLFTKAFLQACDALDGTVDGVIDNLPACLRRFDPSSYVFSDTHQPLQCTGPKTDGCLSKAQIEAVENINGGPRTSRGQTIKAPAGAVAHDHVDNTAFGYQYDGGFMAPTGIPSRKIGTPTTTPGDYSLGLGQLPYIWIQPPDPSFDPLTFNFNSDLARLNMNSVLVTYSTSLDIKKFTRRGDQRR